MSQRTSWRDSHDRFRRTRGTSVERCSKNSGSTASAVRAGLTKDQAEQVQADDEHERDESKPEPN